MKIELNDNKLMLAAKELSGNWTCCSVLKEDYIGPEKVCGARCFIKNGKLKIENNCGEPCNYICHELQILQRNVETIKTVVKILNLVDTAT